MMAPAHSDVIIETGGARVRGTLIVPAGPRALIVLAHGAGATARDRNLAAQLVRRGFATLTVDVVAADADADAEAPDGGLDVESLADRLVGCTDWLRERPEVSRLPVVHVGWHVAAAAAAIAANRRPGRIAAVVSASGHLAAAGAALGELAVPILIVVGGADHGGVERGRTAVTEVPGPVELAIVPGADHLFEAAGAVDEVARLTTEFLDRHLAPVVRKTAPLRRFLARAP